MHANKNKYIEINILISKEPWYKDCVAKALMMHIALMANADCGAYYGEYKAILQQIAEESGLKINQVKESIDKLVKCGAIKCEISDNYFTFSVLKCKNFRIK